MFFVLVVGDKQDKDTRTSRLVTLTQTKPKKEIKLTNQKQTKYDQNKEQKKFEIVK